MLRRGLILLFFFKSEIPVGHVHLTEACAYTKFCEKDKRTVLVEFAQCQLFCYAFGGYCENDAGNEEKK